MPHTRRRFLAGLGSAALAAGRLPGADRPDPLAAIRAVVARKEPVVWVFTGDSITHGAAHTLGWRSYPEHFAERVRWELRRMRDVVINTGISGDVTDRLLADLDWRVLQFRPTVVSIMEGMNDCSRGPGNREAFRKDLKALIEKVRAAGALPLINTQNTILEGRGDLPAYAEITRTVAREMNAALVDHYAHWQEARPTRDKLARWIEDSRLHPNALGHRAFAHLIFKELAIFDPQSPTCRLET
jgi:lysophospholipase L1-like esterase